MPDFTQMPASLAKAILASEAAARKAMPCRPKPTPPKPTLDEARQMLVSVNPDAHELQVVWRHKPTLCIDRQDKVSHHWCAVLTVTAPGYRPRTMVLWRTSKGTDIR